MYCFVIQQSLDQQLPVWAYLVLACFAAVCHRATRTAVLGTLSTTHLSQQHSSIQGHHTRLVSFLGHDYALLLSELRNCQCLYDCG